MRWSSGVLARAVRREGDLGNRHNQAGLPFDQHLVHVTHSAGERIDSSGDAGRCASLHHSFLLLPCPLSQTLIDGNNATGALATERSLAL